MAVTTRRKTIKGPKHKIGDIVAAFSDDNEDEYVMGYVSAIKTAEYGKHYYTVEWNNGLCCDSLYEEPTITGFKNLLKRQTKNG